MAERGPVIVPLGPAGAALLAALHEPAFADPSTGGPPWSAKSFADLLAMRGTSALVAEIDGEPVGLVLVRTLLDEAEILTLCADPAVRRRGVATALMRAAMDRARAAGAARMFLEVAAGNPAARALYAGLGFVETGRRKGYYRHAGHVDDAIVMEAPLA